MELGRAIVMIFLGSRLDHQKNYGASFTKVLGVIRVVKDPVNFDEEAALEMADKSIAV